MGGGLRSQAGDINPLHPKLILRAALTSQGRPQAASITAEADTDGDKQNITLHRTPDKDICTDAGSTANKATLDG